MSNSIKEDFDFSQSFNEVTYSCEDCNEIWNTQEYLEEFSQNYSDYDGYVKGDWHKIIRAIIENLFRPENSLRTTVCPNCSAQGPQSGHIKVMKSGDVQDSDWLKEVSQENELEFCNAVSRVMDLPGSRIDRK